MTIISEIQKRTRNMIYYFFYIIYLLKLYYDVKSLDKSGKTKRSSLGIKITFIASNIYLFKKVADNFIRICLENYIKTIFFH